MSNVAIAVQKKKSEKNSLWEIKPHNEKTANYYVQKYDIPYAIAAILSARGITPDTIENFLSPKLKNSMPSPLALLDMDIAINAMVKAVNNKKMIGVFGDYDVDGGTASAIMKRFCQQIGLEAFIHIPDRMTEGYGPNIKAFLKLKQKGASLLITVDCGSAAPDVMRMAANKGIDVVILDHHITESTTDGAIATVNPNRQDDMSGLGYLTAAGVAFLFCVGVTQALRKEEYFTKNNITEPALMSLLDLAALGTVCDVAPLVDFNRAMVSQGLRVMQHGSNIGISALAKVGRINEKFSSYHCGFVLGPRINAGGRVGRASAGFELLTTDCPITAETLAGELEHYNHERKTIEDIVKLEVAEQIESKKLYDDPVIIAHGQSWHPGIVGIVASRVKDLYHKPTFILGGDEDVFKGSGRSIKGVDIGNAIRSAHEKSMIIAGGGHMMAAGLTISGSQIEGLRDFFRETLSDDVQKALENHAISVDADIPLKAVNFSFFQALEKMAPFGMGNPSPTFCLSGVKVGFCKIIGKDHMKCNFVDNQGGNVNAVAFRCLNTPLGDALMQKHITLDVIGSIKQDTYHTGNKVQFIIDDVRYN